MSNAANTVNFNGQDIQVLPLNWTQLTERREDIIIIDGMQPNQGLFTEAQQGAILRCVHASIERGRPGTTEEWVRDNLDLGNVGDILKLMFGMKKSASNEAGEVHAAPSQT